MERLKAVADGDAAAPKKLRERVRQDDVVHMHHAPSHEHIFVGQPMLHIGLSRTRAGPAATAVTAETRDLAAVRCGSAPVAVRTEPKGLR